MSVCHVVYHKSGWSFLKEVQGSWYVFLSQMSSSTEKQKHKRRLHAESRCLWLWVKTLTSGIWFNSIRGIVFSEKARCLGYCLFAMCRVFFLLNGTLWSGNLWRRKIMNSIPNVFEQAKLKKRNAMKKMQEKRKVISISCFSWEWKSNAFCFWCKF